MRDWRDVHEVLKPYTKVTNIHGHVHQVLYNEIGTMRSIGMLATSWPWPYAPEGVPKLTKPMIRVDPGDHFDGVGWENITVNPATRSADDVEYVMWGRKEVFVQSEADSDDNRTGDPARTRSPTTCSRTEGRNGYDNQIDIPFDPAAVVRGRGACWCRRLGRTRQCPQGAGDAASS